jgi:hypothetical protein
VSTCDANVGLSLSSSFAFGLLLLCSLIEHWAYHCGWCHWGPVNPTLAGIGSQGQGRFPFSLNHRQSTHYSAFDKPDALHWLTNIMHVEIKWSGITGTRTWDPLILGRMS